LLRWSRLEYSIIFCVVPGSRPPTVNYEIIEESKGTAPDTPPEPAAHMCAVELEYARMII